MRRGRSSRRNRLLAHVPAGANVRGGRWLSRGQNHKRRAMSVARNRPRPSALAGSRHVSRPSRRSPASPDRFRRKRQSSRRNFGSRHRGDGSFETTADAPDCDRRFGRTAVMSGGLISGNSPSIVQLVATGLFAVAVLHTFSTRYFEQLAHAQPNHAGLWHLLGEVETVFGFWAMVLLLFLAIFV